MITRIGINTRKCDQKYALTGSIRIANQMSDTMYEIVNRLVSVAEDGCTNCEPLGKMYVWIANQFLVAGWSPRFLSSSKFFLRQQCFPSVRFFVQGFLQVRDSSEWVFSKSKILSKYKIFSEDEIFPKYKITSKSEIFSESEFLSTYETFSKYKISLRFS